MSFLQFWRDYTLEFRGMLQNSKAPNAPLRGRAG